jgi:SAM-dependent methyltransferase
MADSTTRDSGFSMRTIADTIPPESFADLHAYPWTFEPSEHEARKNDETLSVLPNARYHDAFGVGCSFGELTERLAKRCDSLLAVDCSAIDLQRTARREREDDVRFDTIPVPQDAPAEASFDLVLLSEVAYYWSWRDLRWVHDRIVEQLRPGGHLVLVHWAPPGPGKPLTGIEVHGAFMEWASPAMHHLFGRHEGPYWIDLFERTETLARPVSSLYNTILNRADGDSTNPHEW